MHWAPDPMHSSETYRVRWEQLKSDLPHTFPPLGSLTFRNFRKSILHLEFASHLAVPEVMIMSCPFMNTLVFLAFTIHDGNESSNLITYMKNISSVLGQLLADYTGSHFTNNKQGFIFSVTLRVNHRSPYCTFVFLTFNLANMFIILVTLLCTTSSTVTFQRWSGQNCMQCSRCRHTIGI